MLNVNRDDKKKLQSIDICFLNLKYPKLSQGVDQIVVFGRTEVNGQEEIFPIKTFRENMVDLAAFSRDSKNMINSLSDLSRNLADTDEKTRRRRINLKEMANDLDKFIVKFHLFVHDFKK